MFDEYRKQVIQLLFCFVTDMIITAALVSTLVNVLGIGIIMSVIISKVIEIPIALIIGFALNRFNSDD